RRARTGNVRRKGFRRGDGKGPDCLLVGHPCRRRLVGTVLSLARHRPSPAQGRGVGDANDTARRPDHQHLWRALLLSAASGRWIYGCQLHLGTRGLRARLLPPHATVLAGVLDAARGPAAQARSYVLGRTDAARTLVARFTVALRTRSCAR